MACSELFPGFYKINLPIPRGGFESFLDGWFIKDEARAQNILVETGRIRSCSRPRRDVRIS